MQHKQIKAEMISSGKYEDLLAYQWQIYSNSGIIPDKLGADFYQLDPVEFIAFQQLKSARRQSRSRLKKHIDFWIKAGYPLAFGTLTFKDEVMEKTSSKTRRRYIQRFLNDNFDDYIGNIDYGDLTEREHYHFIGVPYILDKFQYANYGKNNNRIKIISDGIQQYESKYGIALVKEVISNPDQVAGYVAKLSNHSIKVKQSKLLVKKGTPFQLKNRLDKELDKKIKYADKHNPDPVRRKYIGEWGEIRDQEISLEIYRKEIYK